MRLTHRIVGLLGGPRRAPVRSSAPRRAASLPAPAPASTAAPAASTAAPAARLPDEGGPPPVGASLLLPVIEGLGAPGVDAALAVGPGAAGAGDDDPCGPARAAAVDACALADRMNALSLAAQERLREARRAYDDHAGRRERAAAVADPRAVRDAKDEAQALFRRARLAATQQGAVEVAAREWLREVDRINARTREAVRVVAREDAAEQALLQAVERLGVEADGARIAAESAAESCRNARIALATCEERERLGQVPAPATWPPRATLFPASVAARAAPAVPGRGDGGPAGAASPGTVPGEAAADREAGEAGEAGVAGVAGAMVPPPEDGAPASEEAEPAILPLLGGDRAVLRRIAAGLAAGDRMAESQWQARLAALVDAIRARAIDGAALLFPEDHPFWGPYTQAQCREIAAALAALGYRFDGFGGFSDGRIPAQRELSLAIGYAGLDPMRVRIWPTEAELPLLFADVQVDAARFVAEAAGELTLGEMIDLLGRRAEDLSELWNAWGRVRPLLLAPA